MKQDRPNILVNATAAVEGGALNILTQFLLSAVLNKDKYNVYVFTSMEMNDFLGKGIEIVTLKKQGYLDRIKWDFGGVRKWAEVRGIKPALIISFQNMGVKFDPTVPQLIYYHQPAPFSKARWNMFDREERVFWMYKWIYPVFTRILMAPRTYFVVQTTWIKKGVMRLFNARQESIRIIRPDIHLCAGDVPEASTDRQEGAPFRIFYPAMPFINKNHAEIVAAIHQLANVNRTLSPGQLQVFFTCEADEKLSFVRRIREYGLEKYFTFTGKLKQEEVLTYYRNADLLVFPSVLETYGLPLMEGASFGLKVLAADLEYAREVLEGYNGAEFVKPHSTSDWAIAISKAMCERKRFSPLIMKNNQGWGDFYNFVDSILKEN